METSINNAANTLAGYFLFRSSDLEYTRSILSKLYRAHGLNVAHARARLDVTARYVRLPHSSLSYLHYGADVTMRPRRKECLGDFLVVQIPLSGTAHVRCGNDVILSTPLLASVVTPSLPLEMEWAADCQQITIRIERSRMEQHCAALLGRPLREPLHFALGMPLNEPAGLRWMRILKMILTDLDDQSLPPSPMLLRDWEQALMTCLLVEHPNTYQEQLRAPTPDVLPRHIKRAVDYIEAHTDQPLTVSMLAAIADVSERTIYAGFRKYCGMAPLQYLHTRRLEQARAELLATHTSGNTVAQIAHRWGFAHLGRFSQAYRQRFGELPSDTLRR